MDKIRVGVAGLGQRGLSLIKGLLVPYFSDRMIITAVCDLYEDRVEKAKAYCDEKFENDTFATTDWHQLIAKNKIDALFVFTAWESHIPISLAALEAKIPVGCEVGGAYSLDQCWQLVHTVERTGTKFMFLENCCYGRKEMMAMNLYDQGLLGDIVYCTGAYLHDLRGEISGGFIHRHYRLRNFLLRNCDNYPTHDLGPICKILGINKNNRMLTLSAMGSSALSLAQYSREQVEAGKEGYDDLAKAHYKQSDITSTNIKCAGGELIQLTFGTTLPRPYSRNFSVMGTKGAYMEVNDSLYLDRDHTQKDGDHWEKFWGNAKDYREQYDHPTWKTFLEGGIVGGHGGMDGLVYGAFFDYLNDKIPCPIDVYDAASWMCISALSEESIAMGGAPVAIPDFTNGQWLMGAGKKTPLFGIEQ